MRRANLKPQFIISQTKKFIHKTLQNLKSFFSKGYQKLPKSPPPNPLSETHTMEMMMKNNPMKQNKKKNVTSSMEEEDEREEMLSGREEGKGGGNGGECARGNAIEMKMKELEMMDVDDLEHVLDIEEVLHHYSRLTCPVYQEMVDKFFMDMYSDFFIPQNSGSGNASMGRLRPLKL